MRVRREVGLVGECSGFERSHRGMSNQGEDLRQLEAVGERSYCAYAWTVEGLERRLKEEEGIGSWLGQPVVIRRV